MLSLEVDARSARSAAPALLLCPVVFLSLGGTRPVYLRVSGATGFQAVRTSSHPSPGPLPRKRIPRIIWQTWRSGDLPEHFRPNTEEVRRRNPEFDYRLVTDGNATALFETHFPGELNRVFKRLMRTEHGAAKADLIRYALLYVFGGVYVDVDSICEGLEQMIKPDDSAVVSHERFEGKWVQWVLAFEPRHPVLMRTLEMSAERLQRPLPRSMQKNMHRAITWCTGPWVYAQALQEFSEQLGRGLRTEAWRGGFGVRAEGGLSSVGGVEYRIQYAPYCREKVFSGGKPKGYTTYYHKPLAGDTLLPPEPQPQH